MSPDELEAQQPIETDTAEAEAQGEEETSQSTFDSYVHYDESEDFRQHSTWDLVRSKGFTSKMKWLGYQCANGANWLGGMLNGIFGPEEGNFSYVLNAAERMEAESNNSGGYVVEGGETLRAPPAPMGAVYQAQASPENDDRARLDSELYGK
jgi:hypothetical protein